MTSADPPPAANDASPALAATLAGADWEGSASQPHSFRWAQLVPLAVGVIFLATLNPWWVPSGDSEVYLAAARSLWLGKGYEFNGAPVSFVPPGWPLLLAGLFHVTTSILWLKVVQIVMLSGFLALSWIVLRRFVSPRIAAGAIVLAALCSPVHTISYWLHSDALMALIAGAAALVAVRYGDGGGRWLLGALVALCVAGVMARWAMMLQAIVLASLLMGTRPSAELRLRRWTAVGLVFGTCLGTYLALRVILPQGEAPVAASLRDARDGSDRSLTVAARPEYATLSAGGLPLALAMIPPEADEARVPDIGLHGEHENPLPVELLRRVASLPQWFAWTLWEPFRATGGFGVPGLLLDWLAGGLALTLLFLAAVRGARRGQWLWAGVLVYVVALAIIWPVPTNRYLVPVVPFLIGGIFCGLGEMKWTKLARFLRGLFVLSLVIANGAIWLVSLWVFRASSAEQFYSRYEAGQYQALIEVAAVLSGRAQPGEVIAASERYENLNRKRQYKTATRMIVYVSGREVRSVPEGLGDDARRRELQQWSREYDVLWYVHQNPLMPGRIWHFRVSPWLHQKITGYAPAPDRASFELYRMNWHPTEEMPERRWLELEPFAAPPEALEQIGRRVPGLPGGFGWSG